MSERLDTNQLRLIHRRAVYGMFDWNLAKEVYDLALPNVSAIPFYSPEGVADWNLLAEWVTKATGDNRTNPGAEKMEKFRQAVMRILRRLDVRAINGNQTQGEDFMTDPEGMAPLFESPLPALPLLARSSGVGGKRKSQTAKFCRCIKSVRKTIRPRKGSTAEQAAIGVCVKSVLRSRGRTLRKFKCGKPARLVTRKYV